MYCWFGSANEHVVTCSKDGNWLSAAIKKTSFLESISELLPPSQELLSDCTFHQAAGLWYPSSRVQTRPKPSDFLRVNKNPQHVGGHECLSVVIVVSCQVDELITRSEESYRLWCVVECNLKNLVKMRSHTQSVVTGPNRRRITGCISYAPLIVTVRHECWMSSHMLQCSGGYKNNSRDKY